MHATYLASQEVLSTPSLYIFVFMPGRPFGRQVDLDSRDAQRDTPLHLAARRCYAGIVELLLAKCDSYLTSSS